MNSASFIKQTEVYFKKIARIAIREKVWKFVVFAAVIALIVAAVVSEKMFTNYESTKSGFFTLTSACIWLGIFNSIQSVCKEHDIIRSEYRQGMRMSSYISANVLWQAIVCFVQAILIFVICLMFGFFADAPTDGVMMHAFLEYFITVYILTFTSSVLGLMVSSVAGNPTAAMTIMPFVLILQLIMSGVLFELTGFSEKVAYITYSKWGMSSFGSIANLNKLEHVMAQNLPDMKDIINEQYPIEEVYKKGVKNLLTSWGWCLGISTVSMMVSIVTLKFKNRDS